MLRQEFHLAVWFGGRVSEALVPFDALKTMTADEFTEHYVKPLVHHLKQEFDEHG